MSKFGTLAKAADQNRRVLNLYDEYLVSKRDARKEAEVLAWILTKNLPEDGNPERDRSGKWSASAVGSCPRQQQFTYLGFPQKRNDPDSMNVFSNGDFLHLRYQVAGMVAGWLTDVEVPLLLGGSVRGTTDGILAWDEVLELKSINARGFAGVLDFGPKRLHRMQATAYMLATGLTRTRFVYENKDRNTNAEFVFDLAPEWVKEVEEQWELMDELTAKQELAPRLHDCINERGFDYKYCDFNKICAKAKFPRRRLTLEE